MAKILICYFSEQAETTYDSISKVLVNNGNDLFRLNLKSKGFNYKKFGDKSIYNNKRVIEDIINFSPDIVISFNNSLPQEIESQLSRKCKICIIDADNPEMFWNKDTLNLNKDKYYYLGMQKYSRELYEKFINIELTDKNYIFFPPATLIKSEMLKQGKNISFIGTNFYPRTDIPEQDYFYDDILLDIYNNVKNDYFYPLELIINKYSNQYDENKLRYTFEIVKHYYAGQERIKYVSVLSDLGLKLYGIDWWSKTIYYDFELASCFDPTTIISLKDNEWVYNTSKISVNISHPQAKTAFSWRVMDIMASNACLLMEKKPDWFELFGEYISDDVKEGIIYKDRFDMRDKAKYLLENEQFRKKCVTELNNAIEKNGRWEKRFSKLEDFLEIRLLNNKNSNTKYIFIEKCEQIPKKNLWQKMKFKQRIKNIFYLFLLILAQIPIIDLIFKKKKRKKLLNKVIKYQR